MTAALYVAVLGYGILHARRTIARAHGNADARVMQTRAELAEQALAEARRSVVQAAARQRVRQFDDEDFSEWERENGWVDQ